MCYNTNQFDLIYENKESEIAFNSQTLDHG